MSLHIEITDEAREELARQKNKSLISSIVVSVLGFSLLAMLFILWKIVLADPLKPEVIAYPEPVSDNPNPESEQISTSTSASAAAQVTSVLTSTATTDFQLPSPEIPVDQPGVFATTTEIGLGSGTGGTGMGTGLPGAMRKRCSLEDRLMRIKESGGSEKFETTVVNGLNYLKKTQKPDGSWEGASHPAAMTGLAILSYLAHCDTPLSEDFGESCEKAIVYLIGLSKKNNGYLATNPKAKEICYEHAICTYALAEAYTFSTQTGFQVEGLKEAVEKAADIVMKTQCKEGSWLYFYADKVNATSHLDLSVTGWNIQAMKAVKFSKARLDDKTMRLAERFVKDMYNAKGYDPKKPGSGCFMYRPGEARIAMVPVGVLSLQMMGLGHSKEARDGIKNLAAEVKPNNPDPYLFYYTAQALINRGGEPWKNYGKALGDYLVGSQTPNGSWNAGVPTAWGTLGNGVSPGVIHYRTCLSILTLAVYYRFLPATGEATKAGSSLGGDE